MMATATESHAPPAVAASRQRVVLGGVPWALYAALRDLPGNQHIRMAYQDGTLELMAPEYIHETDARRLGTFVIVLAEVLDIDCTGARSTTLRLGGEEPEKGSAKEPDESFYIASEPLVRTNRKIDLTVDPPPDLAIEVDNTRDSRRKLAVYARLGVPEVWRYDGRTETLWFGALQADGTYAPVERSLSLPMLTPGIILDLLARCRTTDETTWDNWVRDWARNELLPRHREG